MIKQLRSSHKNVLILDGGDAYSGDQYHALLRADAIAAAMKLMSYDALSMADRDLDIGFDRFTAIARRHGLSYVASNIQILDGNRDFVQPFVIKETGGIRVAITAIVDPRLMPNMNALAGKIAVADPLKSLEILKERLRGQADIVVLLSHFGFYKNRDMLKAGSFAGIDIVISGHGRKIMREPIASNGTVLIQCSAGGEYLGRIDIKLDENKRITNVDGEAIPLTDQIPSDDGAAKIMEKFLQSVKTN